jgi:putative transposase
VGWSIRDSLETKLVGDALWSRAAPRGSGCWCIPTSAAGGLSADAARLGNKCSLSRTGCCYDNAVTERIFWSLKHE